MVADDGYISAYDLDMMAQIIDVSSIKDIYDPTISDPIKNAIRDFGNESFLTENIPEYALVYLRIFLSNPVSYVTAWVDSTCGYWNSGYNYWVWYWDIEQNGYGIARTVVSPAALQTMDEYLWLFYNNRLLQVFLAIGLFVWLTLVLLAKSAASGNRTGVVATVPVLAILLSLLISSPVYAEIRYMYALFCALPILVAISCTNSGEEVPDTEEAVL